MIAIKVGSLQLKVKENKLDRILQIYLICLTYTKKYLKIEFKRHLKNISLKYKSFPLY